MSEQASQPTEDKETRPSSRSPVFALPNLEDPIAPLSADNGIINPIVIASIIVVTP